MKIVDILILLILCMYVCVYVCMECTVCMYCMCVCKCMLCPMHECMYVNMYVCMYDQCVWRNREIYPCIYVCMYVCTYVCMYVCMTCFGYDVGGCPDCDAFLRDHAHDAAVPLLAQQLQPRHIHHVCEMKHIPA